MCNWAHSARGTCWQSSRNSYHTWTIRCGGVGASQMWLCPVGRSRSWGRTQQRATFPVSGPRTQPPAPQFLLRYSHPNPAITNTTHEHDAYENRASPEHKPNACTETRQLCWSTVVPSPCAVRQLWMAKRPTNLRRSQEASPVLLHRQEQHP